MFTDHLKKKFKIIGIDKKKSKMLPTREYNLLNLKKLNSLLKKEKPDLIIHLAAQSLVDETINKKKYFLNNVIATKNLLSSMKKNNIKNIIFSSTAALYKYNNKILNEKRGIWKFECRAEVDNEIVCSATILCADRDK